MLPWRAGRKVAEVGDDQLREMAQHRGLKLVKSRRRKPGTGDFGKYGLTDAGGKALLGIGDDGLTASAQDIQDYLRTSEQSTWKQSADTTPDRPVSPKKVRAPEPEDEQTPVRRRSKPAPPKRPATSAREASVPAPRKVARSKPALRLVSKAEAGPASKPEPEPKPEPKPVPAPVLRVRAVTAADAEALAGLVSQLSGVSLGRAEVAGNLAATRKAKAGMVVAELGDIVGCLGWAVVATVHRGPIGRLTLMIVDKAHRRKGIGTAMLTAAETALAKAGCRQVEAMSDITINNSHNFFRSLKFEQASYRFVRKISE